MGEIFTVDDIRRTSWREDLEERQAYESRRREIEEERERKARAVAEKQQPAAPHSLDELVAVIDERVRGWFDYYFDDEYEQREGNDRRGCYFDMIAKGMADLRRQLRAEFTRADEELQRVLEVKLAALEERQAASVSRVDGRIEATLLQATGGAQGTAREQLRAEFRHGIAEAIDVIGAQLVDLEERLRAVPGRLPIVKNYCSDTVHYAGHVVVHRGATYQALRDTARVPPHVDDWVCIASAGCDGQSVRARGAFNATANYKRFDIVSLDGTAFIARRDNPGIPGISEDGWQVMSRAGTRGPVGEVGPRGRKGERGARGEDAPEIIGWHLECETYRAFPVLTGGRMGPELNLRPLFEKFVEETSRAAE